MKLKLEAEGWPLQCIDDYNKQHYFGEVFQREGMQLNPLQIEKNPSKRAIAKLALNSFWGKFGQL